MSLTRTSGGGKSSNFRPSLTRAETIESCNSDDLVTVLEMHNRKPYKIIDRKREVKKGVMAETLDELVNRGKAKLNYAIDKKVYVVLEEDGTEVDEEEYFQTLPANTLLMLLFSGDRWSPFGPPFTFCDLYENEIQVWLIHPEIAEKQRKTPNSAHGISNFWLGNVAAAPNNKDRRTLLAASSTSASMASKDEPDLSRGPSFDLATLLDRLHTDIGSIAMFSGQELEVLAEFEPEDLVGYKYDTAFLRQIKEAADRHLEEKREIRNALGLLNLYHKSSKSKSNSQQQNLSDASPSKRKRSSQK